jgi:iron complex transport system permease protein
MRRFFGKRQNKGITKRYALILVACGFFLVAAVLAAMCIGRYAIGVPQVFAALAGQENDAMVNTVVWVARFPRVAMAMVMGAGLSVAGVSLQAMFGNPLVSDHTLGVSYSAGFGAALGLLLSGNYIVAELLAAVFGFVGMALTYLLSTGKKFGGMNILMLILSGVIVGSIFEAFTSLVKYVADPLEKLPVITYWLMGSLAGVSREDLVKGIPVILVAIALLWLLRWRLNVISLPRDEARSLGINVRQTQTIVIVASTVIAAVSVSFCGIISFVGLAVPHFARMVIGSDHKYLLPACALIGGVFLVIIDTLARALTAAEIPLSILTATIGGPIFAILLRRTGGAWNDKG